MLTRSTNSNGRTRQNGTQPLLSGRNVSKAFAGVRALGNVSFDVDEGEVHALVGENGAGKSTLMKILAGVQQPDQGEIRWRGKVVKLKSPADAQRLGIGIIHQEFNLLPDLTVAENVMLGKEPRTRLGLVDWRRLHNEARRHLELLKADIDTHRQVKHLSVAQQQIVEIVKALTRDAHLLIMDEPTAALTPVEARHLFDRIAEVTGRGASVVFISHRLEEVLAISDRVTILKDGNNVTTRPANELSEASIVRLMVGRDLSEVFPPRLSAKDDAPVVSVQQLSNTYLKNVTFELRQGEIVGVAGLEGQGQRELARTLFGLETSTGGVTVGGSRVRLDSPRNAIDAGIAFVSEDRKGEGLALTLSVEDNVALPHLATLSRQGIVNETLKLQTVRTVVEQLGVKTPNTAEAVKNLSGGNQQKVVLSKWLITPPKVFIFAEPTRGIDVGAKVEIYTLIHELALAGTAVLVVSSDLIELLGLSSRVLVMRGGQLVAAFDAADATEESVMLAATGTGG